MTVSALATVPSTHPAAALRDRARTLRRLANGVSPILATSYRRRASELELELWIHEIKCGL